MNPLNILRIVPTELPFDCDLIAPDNDRADLPQSSLKILAAPQALESLQELRAATGKGTLFHTAAWVEVLQRAYGLVVFAAMLERAGKIQAGCLLSRARIPFRRRVVGLPFSDFCPPLGVDDQAIATLLSRLVTDRRIGDNLELRGVRAPAPWAAVDCFEQWSLDLSRSFAEVQRGADRNFIRQATRSAQDKSVRIEFGNSTALLARFFRLQLETRRRLGLPPQPWRFFAAVHEVFGRSDGIEVWLASSAKRGDEAAVVLLRDGDTVHAKWSARISGGNTHLLFFKILEQHAGKCEALDLGRTDVRNKGLGRFKAEMGAKSKPLPYSYFPRAPGRISSEHRGDSALTHIWRRLPLPVTHAIGALAYRYFA